MESAGTPTRDLAAQQPELVAQLECAPRDGERRTEVETPEEGAENPLR